MKIAIYFYRQMEVVVYRVACLHDQLPWIEIVKVLAEKDLLSING